MFHYELGLYRFVREYTHRLIQDIDPKVFNHQVFPGTNTPHWILGHLVLGNEFALSCLGMSAVAPREWFMLFGPGSSPAAIPEDAPRKDELLRTFDASHDRVLQTLPSADPVKMASKHSLDIEFLKQLTPTVGDLIAHLMTTHATTHLGQLSFWRRVMGLPGVLA